MDLARSLIGFDTTNPPGREGEAAEHVGRLLRGEGIEVHLQEVRDGRRNLVARLPGESDASLVLTGHLDTVPADEGSWSVDPWEGVVRDGLLYGLGACDMKGAVAAMVAAFIDVARSGRAAPGALVLALTVGEEVDSCGARALCEEGLLGEPRALVVGEPTDMRVGVAHKGALWVTVSTEGVSAHGSQPEAGVNAVHRMLEWMAPFEELEDLVRGPDHPLLGAPSLSVNVISGGSAANVVPRECMAMLDLRTVPGQSHDHMLARLAERSPPASIHVRRDAAPVGTDPHAGIVAASAAAVRRHVGEGEPAGEIAGLPYVTDASVLSAATGAPAVIVGPGEARLAHVADEHVRLSRLDAARHVYRDIAMSPGW